MSSILSLMTLKVKNFESENKKEIGFNKSNTSEENDEEEEEDEEDETKRRPDGSWNRFHLSASSLRLLAAAMSAGLPALRAASKASPQSQQTLRNCLFIAGTIIRH